MAASTFNGRTFDRIPHLDPASRNFAIGDHVIEAATPVVVGDQQPISKQWACSIDLDQGQDGACVGFGWTHWQAADPCDKPGLTYDSAMALYHSAQAIDGNPDPHEGSTVLAGAQVVQQEGVITSYKWAFSKEEIVLALGHVGPVVLGVDWYEGMFDVEPNGIIEPTGTIAGGHCILARAIDVDDMWVTLHNSWGPSWGKNGDAYITVDNLWRILVNDGESCIPIISAAATPTAA